MKVSLGAWFNLRKVPSPQLPSYPDSCFGNNLGLLDPNNKYTGSCWEARAPFRDQFRDDILPEIKEFLETYPNTARTSDRITISLYMIGQSTMNAEPTIIFISEDATARKAARKAIHKSGILAAYPGFTTKSVSKDPGFGNLQTLASGSGSLQHDMTSHVEEVFYDPSQSTRPGSMVVYVRHASTFRPTTAFLVQEGTHVALKTVYHAFLPSSIPSAENSEDTLDDIEVDSDTDSESEDDEEFNINMTSMWSRSSYTYSDSGSGTDRSRRSSMSSVRSTRRAEPTHLSGNSTRIPDLSAVVSRLEEYKSTRPSYPVRHLAIPDEDKLVPLGTLAAWSLDKDWAMIKITNLDFVTAVTASNTQERKNLQVVYKRSEQPKFDASVVAYTSSNQKLCGTLSGTPSCMQLPNGDSYQEVYTVNLKGGLANGDCGSPIVDASSGVLYGHIVAGCRSTGTAYIMAAYHHEMDIQKALQECEQPMNREVHAASETMRLLFPFEPALWLRAIQCARMELPLGPARPLTEALNEVNTFWTNLDTMFGFVSGIAFHWVRSAIILIAIENALRILPFTLPDRLSWAIKASLMVLVMCQEYCSRFFFRRFHYMVRTLKICFCFLSLYVATTVQEVSIDMRLNHKGLFAFPLFPGISPSVVARMSEWLLPLLAFAYTLPKKSHQALWNTTIVTIAILVWNPDISLHVLGYTGSFTYSLANGTLLHGWLNSENGADSPVNGAFTTPSGVLVLCSTSVIFVLMATSVEFSKIRPSLSLISMSRFLRVETYQLDYETFSLRHSIHAAHVFSVAFSGIVGVGLYKTGPPIVQSITGVRIVEFFQRVTGKLSDKDVRPLLAGCVLGIIILVTLPLVCLTLYRRKTFLPLTKISIMVLTLVAGQWYLWGSSLSYLHVELDPWISYTKQVLDSIIGAFNWSRPTLIFCIAFFVLLISRQVSSASADFNECHRDRFANGSTKKSAPDLSYDFRRFSRGRNRKRNEVRDIMMHCYQYSSAFSKSEWNDVLLDDEKLWLSYKEHNALFIDDPACRWSPFAGFAAFASVVWLVVFWYASTLTDLSLSKVSQDGTAHSRSTPCCPEQFLFHVAQVSALISIALAWKCIAHWPKPGARMRLEHAAVDWNIRFHLPIAVTWVATQLITAYLERNRWLADLVILCLGPSLVAMTVWIWLLLAVTASRSAFHRLFESRSGRVREIVICGLLVSLGSIFLFLFNRSDSFLYANDATGKLRLVTSLYAGSLCLFTLSTIQAMFMIPGSASAMVRKKKYYQALSALSWVYNKRPQFSRVVNWNSQRRQSDTKKDPRLEACNDLLTLYLQLAVEDDIRRMNVKYPPDTFNILPHWKKGVSYSNVDGINDAVAQVLQAINLTRIRLRNLGRDTMFHWKSRLEAWRRAGDIHKGSDLTPSQCLDLKQSTVSVHEASIRRPMWSWKVAIISVVCLASVVSMGINSFLLKEVENWKRAMDHSDLFDNWEFSDDVTWNDQIMSQNRPPQLLETVCSFRCGYDGGIDIDPTELWEDASVLDQARKDFGLTSMESFVEHGWNIEAFEVAEYSCNSPPPGMPWSMPCVTSFCIDGPREHTLNDPAGSCFAVKSFDKNKSDEAYEAEALALLDISRKLSEQHIILAEIGKHPDTSSVLLGYLDPDRFKDKVNHTSNRLNRLVTLQKWVLECETIDALLKESDGQLPYAALSIIGQACGSTNTDFCPMLDPGPANLWRSTSTKALSEVLFALSNLTTALKLETPAKPALRDAYTAFSNHFKQLDAAIDRALAVLETRPSPYPYQETQRCQAWPRNDAAFATQMPHRCDFVSRDVIGLTGSFAWFCGKGALITETLDPSQHCCAGGKCEMDVTRKEYEDSGGVGEREWEWDVCHLGVADLGPEGIRILARRLRNRLRGRCDLGDDT